MIRNCLVPPERLMYASALRRGPAQPREITLTKNLGGDRPSRAQWSLWPDHNAAERPATGILADAAKRNIVNGAVQTGTQIPTTYTPRYRDGRSGWPILGGRVKRRGGLTESWTDQANRLHRDDGPAKLVWHPNHRISQEAWWIHGSRHRADDPAWLWWYPDGQQQREAWYEDGRDHRIGGPAVTAWFEDGNVELEIWFDQGLCHRDGDAAMRRWNENGQQELELWCTEGLRHRLTGPAVTRWSDAGELQEERWYVRGEELTSRQFAALTDLVNQDVPLDWALQRATCLWD